MGATYLPAYSGVSVRMNFRNINLVFHYIRYCLLPLIITIFGVYYAPAINQVCTAADLSKQQLRLRGSRQLQHRGLLTRSVCFSAT